MPRNRRGGCVRPAGEAAEGLKSCHGAPIPVCEEEAPCCPGGGLEEAVREQNRLLSDLTCAINGLTGVLLTLRRGRE